LKKVIYWRTEMDKSLMQHKRFGRVKSGSDSRFVTYANNQMALDLYTKIKAASNGTPCVCAIMVDRSTELVLSIMTILESGYVYLPVDPIYPQERIDFMIKDSDAKIIITQMKYKSRFAGRTVICIDAMYEETVPFVSMNQSSLYKGLAYIIYTSGTTGQPKGVMVTRKSLRNFIEGVSEVIDFSTSSSIACFTSVSFDIFFLETIMVLYMGLDVIVANENEQRNPKLMSKFIIDNNIDMLQMTASRMQLLANHDEELSCLKNIKVIMIGGEPFPFNLLQMLHRRTGARIYNMYGPTETTIWSTISDLTDKDHVDIGRPIKNTEILVVDENLNIVPNGEIGELCIAGAGLAKGYINKEALTNERFTFLPQYMGKRIFRTGDYGKILQSGNLEYVGRMDNQVKIRGFRVELEEIENVINQYADIERSVVSAVASHNNDKLLICYYTGSRNVKIKDIKAFLSTKLPEYMIPMQYIKVDQLKLTANGKLDRKSITNITNAEKHLEKETQMSVNVSSVEKRIVNIILEYIDMDIADTVKQETDFHSLGIDSISFIKIAVAIEAQFKFEFDDDALDYTRYENVGSLVGHIQDILSKKINLDNGKGK
jgi:amino acid adenylation domain-containing protein